MHKNDGIYGFFVFIVGSDYYDMLPRKHTYTSVLKYTYRYL